MKPCFYALYLKIRIKLLYDFSLPKLSLKKLAIWKNVIEKGWVCPVKREKEGGGW